MSGMWAAISSVVIHVSPLNPFKMSFRPVGVVSRCLFWALFSSVAISSAGASEIPGSCSEHLSSEYYVEKSFVPASGGAPIRYHASKLIAKEAPHNVEFILPHIPKDDRLFIVFSEDHVYLHYKNHRIDSQGRVGFSVRSFVRKSHVIRGDLAFLIHHLPKEAKAFLDEQIQNPQLIRALTCTRAACQTLLGTQIKDLEQGYYLSSSLAKRLLKAHRDGKPVEVISLSYYNPEQLLTDMQAKQTSRVFSASVTAGLLVFWTYMASLLF